MDVSVNKPVKDHIKQCFHSWYAQEVQSQLQSSVPVHEVKVDVRASIVKAKSINWFISAWESIKTRPDIVINGFKKAGILMQLKLLLKTKAIEHSFLSLELIN